MRLAPAPGVVLADAGHGNDSGFRGAVSALGLKYAMGVLGSTSLWPAARTWRSPGQEPLAPKPKGGRGLRPGPIGPPGTRLRRDEAHQPASGPDLSVSAKDLAMSLKPRAWKTLTWHEGTNAPPGGRFAAPRVRPAHRDQTLSKPRPREWLLIEWPPGEDEPTKYWLSTLNRPGFTGGCLV